MKKECIEKKHIGTFELFNENEEIKYEKVLGYIDKDKKGDFYLYIEETFVKTSYKSYKMCRHFQDELDGFHIVGTIDSFQENGDLTNLIGNNKCSLLSLRSYELLKNSHIYTPDYIVFGEVSGPNPEFSSVSFTFDGLFEFFGEGSFELQQTAENGGNAYFSPDKINITINKSNISTNIGDTEDLTIFIIKNVIGGEKSVNYHSINFENNNEYGRIQKGFEIKNETFIKIDFKNGKALKDIENVLLNFKRLFSLISGKIIFLDSVSIFYKDDEGKNRNIGVIFNNISSWNSNEDINKKPFFCFNYNEIKKDLGNILDQFIKNTEKFKTIYNLYYATLQNKNLHLENQFLNVIQAIEGFYYKTSVKEEYITDDKKKEIQGKIDDCKKIPKKEKKKYLSIKTDFSLAQKLGQVEKYLGIKFKLKNQDIKEKVNNIRNCFSHGGDREDYFNGKNGDIVDLFYVTEFLKVVLELFILKELGLKDDLYIPIRDYKIKDQNCEK